MIASRSAAPDFRILLYPTREGDPLPVTTWNSDRTLLTIGNGKQRDAYTLVKDADGRAEIGVARLPEGEGGK